MALGPFTLQSGAASGSTGALPGGTQYNVTAHYQGNGTYAPSDSAPVAVTFAPEASKLLISVPTFDPTTGRETSANATTIAYGSPYLLRMDVANSSGALCNATTIACPTGNLTVTDNGTPLDAGTYALNSAGFTEDQHVQVSQLPGGTHAIAANYRGDNSYAPSAATDTVTVTPVATSSAFRFIPPNNIVGTTFYLQATVSTQSFGKAPSGTVTFFDGSTPLTGTASYVPADGTVFGATAQLVATLNNITFSTNCAHTVSAKYSGDSNYTGSTAASGTISVLYPVNIPVSVSPYNVPYGSTTNATAIVDTNVPNLRPTGTVTFTSNGPIPGTVTYAPVIGPSGNAALQATISSITPPAGGVIVATYSGDFNYASGFGSGLVNVIVPDFSINPNPASLTITAGQQASSAVAIVPLSSSSSSVALSCANPLLYGATCTITPASVNLSNNATANATLSLTTLAPSSVPSATKIKVSGMAGPSRLGWWWGLAIVSGVGAIFVVILPGGRGRYHLAMALSACCVIIAALGCGGGSSGAGGTTGGGGGGGSPPAPTSVTIKVSSNKVPAGTLTTATATVTSAQPVTGTITFWEVAQSGALTPPLTITNGMAQAQLNLIYVGSHQVYAQYSGDSANQASQSSPVNIVLTGTSYVAITGVTGPLTHYTNVSVTIQ